MTLSSSTLPESDQEGPAVTRTESDSLGSLEIPDDAYWGIHTARALENFPISKRPISIYPDLVRALATVKLAAARANTELGTLPAHKAELIEAACRRIIDGEFHDQFVVGVIQGGAGTSTNMNANEVVANVALEITGAPRATTGPSIRSTTSTGASRPTTSTRRRSRWP